MYMCICKIDFHVYVRSIFKKETQNENFSKINWKSEIQNPNSNEVSRSGILITEETKHHSNVLRLDLIH